MKNSDYEAINVYLYFTPKQTEMLNKTNILYDSGVNLKKLTTN